MSAAIHARVLERRAAVARAQAEAAERDAFLAAARGAKGDKGDAGPMPAHEWKGSKLRFEQPDGKWGKFVDLKGKPGKDGEAGAVIVRGGGSSFNPTTLGELPGGTLPSDFVIVERNGTAYRVPVSSLATGGEEVATYAKRTDFISDEVFYRGEAAPGTAESAAFWRIARVTIGADGDVTEEWAAGSAAFDKAWDDRASLSYS